MGKGDTAQRLPAALGARGPVAGYNIGISTKIKYRKFALIHSGISMDRSRTEQATNGHWLVGDGGLSELIPFSDGFVSPWTWLADTFDPVTLGAYGRKVCREATRWR